VKLRVLFVLVSVIPALTACDGGHRFVVAADRPMKSGTVTLTGDRAIPLSVYGKLAKAKTRGGDASGAITVRFVDGSEVRCQIGYITSGEIEPHNVSIRYGRCPTINAEL